MSVAGIQDPIAREEIRKLRAEIRALRNLATRLINNRREIQDFSSDDIIIYSDTQPDTVRNIAIWVNTSALPWKSGLLLRQTDGTLVYNHLIEGN